MKMAIPFNNFPKRDPGDETIYYSTRTDDINTYKYFNWMEFVITTISVMCFAMGSNLSEYLVEDILTIAGFSVIAIYSFLISMFPTSYLNSTNKRAWKTEIFMIVIGFGGYISYHAYQKVIANLLQIMKNNPEFKKNPQLIMVAILMRWRGIIVLVTDGFLFLIELRVLKFM